MPYKTSIEKILKSIRPWQFKCATTKKIVIFAPTKIMEYEDGGIGIAWSCSYGEDCQNQDCRYSRAWKNRHK